MGRKRDRAQVLQVLYAMEIREDFRPELVEEILRDRIPRDENSRDFITRTILGVIEKRKEIDHWIGRSSEHWSLSRIAAVDGTILRMAVYELLSSSEVPIQIIINEAVELAKLYGGEDSGGFVNGVLDQVARSVRGDSSEGETGQSPG